MRHTLRGILSGGILSAVVGLTTAAAEPPEPSRLRFFACATVRFFGEACPPAADSTLAPATPPASAPAGAPTAAARSASAAGPSAPDAPPPDTAPPPAPLFTPETVSPDTPPLLLRLLQEPTEANARAFLAWYQARLARIQQVQALLRALSTPPAEAPARQPTAPDTPGPDLPASPPLLPPPATPRQPVPPAE